MIFTIRFLMGRTDLQHSALLTPNTFLVIKVPGNVGGKDANMLTHFNSYRLKGLLIALLVQTRHALVG